MKSVMPFLMFQDGQAEQAMNYYTSIIEDSSITSITRYGENEAGDVGTVMSATFKLKDQEVMCIDSNIAHQFHFTPSFSFYLNCDTEEELLAVYEQLKEGGAQLMPLDNYGFSQKFAWVNDRFGVSWQINLP